METSREMASEVGREGTWTETNLKIVKKHNETSSQRTSKNKLILWKMPCFLKKSVLSMLGKALLSHTIEQSPQFFSNMFCFCLQIFAKLTALERQRSVRLPVAEFIGVAEDNIVYLNFLL